MQNYSEFKSSDKGPLGAPLIPTQLNYHKSEDLVALKCSNHSISNAAH